MKLIVISILGILITKEFYIVEEEFLVVLTFVAFLFYLHYSISDNVRGFLDSRAIHINTIMTKRLHFNLEKLEKSILISLDEYSILCSILELNYIVHHRGSLYINNGMLALERELSSAVKTKLEYLISNEKTLSFQSANQFRSYYI